MIKDKTDLLEEINFNDNEKNKGLGFFEKYLTLWVAICIVVGVLIGVYLPQIPKTLDKFTYAQVSMYSLNSILNIFNSDSVNGFNLFLHLYCLIQSNRY